MHESKSENISFIKTVIIFLCLFQLFLLTTANAQADGKESPVSLSWEFDENINEEFSIGRFLSDTFTPQIITDTRHIREYIRDERFQILRSRYSDMRTIDAIYLKSLKIAEYNIARALFLSLMAVLEHRKVGVKMPIFNSFEAPLTFEEDSIFSARIKHLPSMVYKDTPNSQSGDRDKLQHFFASAYIAYASEAPEFTRTTGDLVEWLEAKFIIGGVDDPRDKRANQHGKSFGNDLLVVKTLLPSDYLTFPLEDRK